MSNIKVEEYIRTEKGFIRKVDEIDRCQECNEKIYISNENIKGLKFRHTYHFKEITKHSKNIVDLIEVGDIVNKEKVKRIYKSEQQQYIVLETRNIFKRDSKDIKTILTHELYEQNSYKVEE